MTSKDEILDYFGSNKPVLLEKYQLQSIALIGSYARKEQNESSDIDLLIEFKDDVTEIHKKKSELREEISGIFHLKVDICRDKYIKDCFRNLIYRDAIYI